METHYCSYVLLWGFANEDKTQLEAKERCDKIARFKTPLGWWYCAEHWDMMDAQIDAMTKNFEFNE